MQLLKIEDNRDNLERLNPIELEIYAKNNGITELAARTINTIQYPKCSIIGAPPPQVIDELRLRGLRGPNVMHRTLGQPIRWVDEQAVVRKDQQQEKVIDIKTMTRAELAKECKRRGVKMARTDKIPDLIARLA